MSAGAAEGPATAPVLLVEHDDGVTTLTLNRPERLNALNSELLGALREALTAARDDDHVRAIVLTGAGRGFCGGADLTEAGGDIPDVRTLLTTRYSPVIHLLRSIETPVVAAVNGVAAGAGVSLALACDLRLCADTATFIQAFVRIGLIPDAGGTFFLPRLVGFARAAEMAMLGDSVTAADAERVGLVNRSVRARDLMGEAHALAARLARGPMSVGLIKRALNMSLTSDLDAQMQHEADLQAIAAKSDDAAEGVAAFAERRQARFTGR